MWLVIALLVGQAICVATTTSYVSRQGTTWQQQLAIGTCAGLQNRPTSTTPAYQYNTGDVWLGLVENITTKPSLTNYSDFISTCLKGPAGGRYIRYNSTTQRALIPNIITLVAVLDAVPLQSTDERPEATVLALDALAVSPPGTSPHGATRYVFENHVNVTTAMNKLNPGYEDQSGKAILRPKLTKTPDTVPVDYIVKDHFESPTLPHHNPLPNPSP